MRVNQTPRQKGVTFRRCRVSPARIKLRQSDSSIRSALSNLNRQQRTQICSLGRDIFLKSLNNGLAGGRFGVRQLAEACEKRRRSGQGRTALQVIAGRL